MPLVKAISWYRSPLTLARANGIWLWAATDNLRIAAVTAVECAEIHGSDRVRKARSNSMRRVASRLALRLHCGLRAFA